MSDARAPGPDAAGPTPLQRLRVQLLGHWHEPPAELVHALEALLCEALERAAGAAPAVLTVMNPTSRPQRLRLAVLVGKAELDSFYHNEWAELAVSDAGRCYLVYRRRDGGDYAVEWSTATSVPQSLLERLPEPLAAAMLESDDHGER